MEEPRHLHVTCGALICVIATAACTEAAAPGGKGLHSVAYFDRLYEGLLALYEQNPFLASTCFQKAGLIDPGKEQFIPWKREMGRLIAGMPDTSLDRQGLLQLIRKHEILKYYFLAEAMASLEFLSDDQRLTALDYLIGLDLASRPWSMPQDVAVLLRHERARAHVRPKRNLRDAAPAAVTDFEAVARSTSNSNWAANATRALVSIHYGKKEHPKARAALSAYLENEPYTDERPFLLLEDGKCLVMMRDYAGGVSRFDQIILEHPASECVAKARKYRDHCRKKLGN